MTTAVLEEVKTETSAGLGERGENLSIMIPTYNCAAYLKETLESIKAQGRKVQEAQIEVVDDCSTKDDPEAAAREVWGDRVVFYRHPKNVGPAPNFNACLRRAQRKWVHILHGDDMVLPEAYTEFDRTIRELPEAIAVFGRSVFIKDSGIWNGMTPPFGSAWRGRLKYDPYEWRLCPVQFAGVLISQEAVKQAGEFDPQLLHVSDFNLWWRFAKTEKVAFTNRCVGAYRIFEGNHTSTLRRTGKNLQEQIVQVKLAFKDYASGRDETAFWKPSVQAIVEQSRVYLGDREAFGRNLALFKELPGGSFPGRIPFWLRLERLKQAMRGGKK